MRTHRKIAVALFVAVLVASFFLFPLSQTAQPARAQPRTSCQLTWSQVPAPDIPGAPVELTGIAAYDADHAWLAGRYRQPSGVYLPVVFYWDGSAWTGRDVPITSSYLFALQGIGPDNLWALSANVNVVHWDGQAWTALPQPPGIASTPSLFDLQVLASDDIWVVGMAWDGTANVTLADHWDGAQWTRVPSPNLTNVNYLSSISAVSPDDIWAVGFANDASQQYAIIFHWNGTEWQSIPLQIQERANLHAVTAIAAGDVWAVGVRGSYPNEQPLAVHWDGQQWNIADVPKVDGTSPRFEGVTAIASDDVWAVGASSKSLTMHWDGTEWHDVSNPSVGVVYGVAAGASNAVWAYTYDAFVMKWNGAAWDSQALPPVGTAINTLNDLAVLAPDDIWTVGYSSGVKGVRSLIEHWDGEAWQVVDSPDIAGYQNLYGVDGISPDDVWSVGESVNNNERRALVQHWDGTQWTMVTAPSLSEEIALRDIAVLAPDNVWVVGQRTGPLPTQKLVAHWDGTAWAILDVPQPPEQDNFLSEINALAPDDIWAVGSDVLHWDGTAWSIVKKGYTSALSARATDDIWVSQLPRDSQFSHWDGVKWADSSPAPTDTLGIFISTIDALAPDNVYAGGNASLYKAQWGIVQHWNGTAWSTVDLPGAVSNVNAIQAASPEEVWAVGDTLSKYSGSTTSVILHGTTPCYVPTPTIAPSPTPRTPQPQVPVLLSPRNLALVASLRPVLNWRSVKNAVTYRVQLRATRGTWRTNTTVTGSEYKTPKLVRGQSYLWRVRACDTVQCGKWSSFFTFTVNH